MAAIEILFIRKGWLAVDKPPGLSVHNDPGNDLAGIVTDRIRSENTLQEQLEIMPSFKVHPIHRLDKETSGVVFCNGSRCLTKPVRIVCKG